MPIKFYKILFPVFAALLMCWVLPAHAESRGAASQKELKKIQEELKGVKKKAKEKEKQERSVLAEINRIDKSIAGKRAEVAKFEAKLDQMGREIGVTETDLDSYRAKMKSKEDDLSAQLRSMYITQRAGGFWVLLLSGDYGSILKRYKYLSVISQRDKRMIDSYQGDIDELGQYSEKLKVQREKFDNIKTARDNELRKVQAQEDEKQKLLASIRKQKSSYEAMAKDLEEQSRQMQQLLKKLGEESRSKTAKQLPRSVPSLTPGLDWPVSGRVISGFGRQMNEEFNTYIYRKGIEIQAARGTDVRAVETAVVAYASSFKGLGLITILRHGGDLYTVYAHLADLRVKSGEKVSRGQVIATVGDGGASGSSLYFEVRKGSEAQDPLRWLKKR
jgi:murein hydrolase activator